MSATLLVDQLIQLVLIKLPKAAAHVAGTMTRVGMDLISIGRALNEMDANLPGARCRGVSLL